MSRAGSRMPAWATCACRRNRVIGVIEPSFHAVSKNFETLMKHPSPTVSVDQLKDLFDWLLKGLAPDVICDIGAFDAGDSIRMRKLVPSARIFAFEANPHNHVRYKARAEEAGVLYERLAIADHDGDISFNIVREEGVDEEKARQVAGQSSIFATLDEHKISESTIVPCQRLDAYLRSKVSETSVIALWIDAESAGYQVLLGAREALKRAKLIKIETEYWPYRLGQNLVGDIRSLLVEAGFTELANDDTKLGQCDLLWIRV